MPGTSTVPTILAGETGYLIALTFVDDNDNTYSYSFLSKAAVTDAELQSLVNAAQAGSNASIYKIETSTMWEGARNASNALSAVHESVSDKVRYSLKDLTTRAYNEAYNPAPIAAWVGSEGIVDTAQATYITWKAAIDAVMPASFTPLNVAFVQYSARNDSSSP